MSYLCTMLLIKVCLRQGSEILRGTESLAKVLYVYSNNILVPPNLIENFVFFGYKISIQRHFKSRLQTRLFCEKLNAKKMRIYA